MADHRSTDPGVARIILKAQELNEDRRAALLRKLRRENMGSMMIGVLSISLAVVVSTVTMMGLAGIPFGSLSAPYEVLVKTKATRNVDRWTSIYDGTVPGNSLVPAYRIYVPSAACERLAFLGVAIGGIGLVWSWKLRTIAWSSAIGVILILSMMVVVAAGSLLRLWPEPTKPSPPALRHATENQIQKSYVETFEED